MKLAPSHRTLTCQVLGAFLLTRDRIIHNPDRFLLVFLWVFPPVLALNLKVKYGQTNTPIIFIPSTRRQIFVIYDAFSGGSHRTPQLTLEPSHSHKKIATIQQWVSAFNIFVSIYAERYPNETPRLIKYCEVVRDLAIKSGGWFWYDEQFRYIRQSNPDPWDQIHWELWLRAANSFRKQQPFTNKFQTQPRQRFRHPFFPKGTCWSFQAGKRCSGCQFEHSCFKCGAQHPGSQCAAQTTSNRFGNKGKGGAAVTTGSTQPTGNPGKGGLS